MSSLPPMRRAITPEPEMLSNSVSFPYEPLFYPSALYKSYSKPVWGNPVEAAPIRTTSVSYAGTSPWSSTGFYYSPRYPEAYRGTSSTYAPYSYSRRYYDFDVFNPYRIEYFKFPRKDYNFGYVPYKYSRKHLLGKRN